MAEEIKILAIDLLRLDFQPAENLVSFVVDEYSELLRQGSEAPQVIAYFDGEEYWLYDGFHRVAAARALGIREVAAEIHLGTYADMQAEWQEYLRALKRDLAGGNSAPEGSPNPGD